MRALVSAARVTVGELRDTLGSLRPDLSATLSQLNETAANLAQLTHRVDAWLIENEPEFQHFINNGLGQAPELMFDLRGTLRELQKLLLQLQEDPSQLIHRPPDDSLEVQP
jgi:ABC-type transporter Mla subunit MlaD